MLAGNRAVDLFDHLRKFNQNPAPKIQKVRSEKGILYYSQRREPGIALSRNKSRKSGRIEQQVKVVASPRNLMSDELSQLLEVRARGTFLKQQRRLSPKVVAAA
jgi:hypothetical protein